MATPMNEAHVGDPNRPPFDAVGMLEVAFNDGSTGFGSGGLVRPHHVVTCSHMITGQKRHGQNAPSARSARFYPRWDSRKRPRPENGIDAANGFFASRYRDGEDSWDIGVFLLRAAAPEPRAYFRPQATDTARLVGKQINLAGYPGNHGGEMWWDVDEVEGVHIEANQLLFAADTDSGSSGSPVYKYDAVNDALNLYGVHNSANRTFGLKSGLLITPPVYDWLQRALARRHDETNFAIGLGS